MAKEHAAFRPDIEGLRAVAVALVVLGHARVPGFAGGYVGVDVFFVISGFLITSQQLRAANTPPGSQLLTFYARRARRILPAASLVLAVTVLASYHWLGFVRGQSVAEDGRNGEASQTKTAIGATERKNDRIRKHRRCREHHDPH